jgi:hypothetical protein
MHAATMSRHAPVKRANPWRALRKCTAGWRSWCQDLLFSSGTEQQVNSISEPAAAFKYIKIKEVNVRTLLTRNRNEAVELKIEQSGNPCARRRNSLHLALA